VVGSRPAEDIPAAVAGSPDAVALGSPPAGGSQAVHNPTLSSPLRFLSQKLPMLGIRTFLPNPDPALVMYGIFSK
jgi:hypothetical protein